MRFTVAVLVFAALVFAEYRIIEDKVTPEDTPCCQTCTEPQEKYFSIDKVHNMCGECCMNPKDYNIYHIFEPGLTKASDNTPCGDNNFKNYTSTVTHGFGPVKMTLDLYSRSVSQKPPLVLTVIDNLSIDDDPCKLLATESTCNKNADCTWCKSKAVQSECVNKTMAAKLPPAVFSCDAFPPTKAKPRLGATGFHASCKMTMNFYTTNCSDVINSLSVAAKSMMGLKGCGQRFPPVDNFCGYAEVGRTSNSWQGKHTTASGKYTDDLTFTMTVAGSGCSVAAYSTSETWYAVLDNSVNYCNLHNLAAETPHMFEETDVSDSTCTQYSSANCSRY